jgi:hypothetical protein
VRRFSDLPTGNCLVTLHQLATCVPTWLKRTWSGKRYAEIRNSRTGRLDGSVTSTHPLAVP